jgi:hypothetical protein
VKCESAKPLPHTGIRKMSAWGSGFKKDELILIVTAGNNKHLPVRFTQLENN